MLRNSGHRRPDLLYRLFVFGFGGACVLFSHRRRSSSPSRRRSPPDRPCNSRPRGSRFAGMRRCSIPLRSATEHIAAFNSLKIAGLGRARLPPLRRSGRDRDGEASDAGPQPRSNRSSCFPCPAKPRLRPGCSGRRQSRRPQAVVLADRRRRMSSSSVR